MAIDALTNDVVANIRVGTAPVAVLYARPYNRVYCVNSQTYNVSVIDCTGDSVIATVSLGAGHAPAALYFNTENGRVYVASGGADDVKVIDCNTNTVRRTITVGHTPMAFAVNPALNRTFVANNGSSNVSVIRDSLAGVEEEPGPQTVSVGSQTTVVHGALFLPEANGDRRGAIGELLDIQGRSVMKLKPGPNDVSRLAPGVYFVRAEPQAASPNPQAVRKVVIQE
jgi:YVTN family beta-propeller protein